MHKYISASILSILSAYAMAEGKFDLGVAVGGGMTATKETLIVTIPILGTRDGYKYSLKQSGPVGGITTGYSRQQNHTIYGLSLAWYKDFYTGRNAGYKTDFISGFQGNFTKDLKRTDTLEFAGKIGRKLNENIDLYGKIGLLRSQFREQYKDRNADIRQNIVGWGGVVGLGIQKSYSSFNLGIEYAYNYYERMGSTVYYVGLDPSQNHSKFQPQYHQVFVKISKSF